MYIYVLYRPYLFFCHRGIGLQQMSLQPFRRALSLFSTRNFWKFLRKFLLIFLRMFGSTVVFFKTLLEMFLRQLGTKGEPLRIKDIEFPNFRQQMNCEIIRKWSTLEKKKKVTISSSTVSIGTQGVTYLPFRSSRVCITDAAEYLLQIGEKTCVGIGATYDRNEDSSE